MIRYAIRERHTSYNQLNWELEAMDLYMSSTRELEATRAFKHLMFQSYTLRTTKQQLRFSGGR